MELKWDKEFTLRCYSHELKIPLSYIRFCERSTTTVPNGKYTAGSVGTEINARAVQIEGAFIQEVGLYTLEEIYFSPEGEQLTLGPDTYKIPAICDIPEQFCVYLLPNSCNSIASYSSKANTPNLPFASVLGDFAAKPSVFFAIPDAVAAAQKERGLPLDFTLNSPLTVEWIRMACDDVFTEMIPKDKPGTYKPWAINID